MSLELICLEVSAKNIKCTQNDSGALTTACALRNWNGGSVQPRITTGFFIRLVSSTDALSSNKLTSFSNLCLLWSKDLNLLVGQKWNCFSTHVSLSREAFKVPAVWVFHSLFFFLTSRCFPSYFDLTSSALTFQSYFSLPCNENTDSRYILWEVLHQAVTAH